MYYAHRIAYQLAYGHTPELIDHACRNKKCCNPTHLRPATNKQNLENQGLRINNRSGSRGVFWMTRERRWCGSVGHNGKYHRRAFRTREEAERYVIDTRNRLFTHNDADRHAKERAVG